MRSGRRAVVVVCDSLCADLVAPHVAPALAALRAQGADFVSARGVFPSTTRTSSASMATGCLPAAHGLLGNTMVLREQGALVRLSVPQTGRLTAQARRCLARCLAEKIKSPALFPLSL